MKTMTKILLFGLILSSGGGLMASDYTAFYHAVHNAYADYRMALFQSNQNHSIEARNSMEQFLNKWNAILDKYLDDPPCVYADDTLWSKSLTEVQSIIKEGISTLDAGNLTRTHEIIEQIRDVLSDLRRRNHVIDFSDYVNNYHSQMEYIIKEYASRQNFTPQEKLHLREALAVLRYLGDQMKFNAPDTYQYNPQFSEALNTNFDAINIVATALDSPDATTIRNAIKDLKPAFSMLFVNFG